jgi:hypothetical protein
MAILFHIHAHMSKFYCQFIEQMYHFGRAIGTTQNMIVHDPSIFSGSSRTLPRIITATTSMNGNGTNQKIQERFVPVPFYVFQCTLNRNILI